uniref:Uncharacterized protein n=2 Tax=Macaca TaxID=9539 RepID=A0A5F7ZNA5_MACMU
MKLLKCFDLNLPPICFLCILPVHDLDIFKEYRLLILFLVMVSFRGFCFLVLVLETGLCSIAQAGIQWRDDSSLQPRTPELKGPSCFSLLSSWDYRPAPSRLANFLFFVEMGCCYVAQCGLKLLGSRDPPTSAAPSARSTGTSHRAGTVIL